MGLLLAPTGVLYAANASYCTVLKELCQISRRLPVKVINCTPTNAMATEDEAMTPARPAMNAAHVLSVPRRQIVARYHIQSVS